jgi:hypothetical protein
VGSGQLRKCRHFKKIKLHHCDYIFYLFATKYKIATYNENNYYCSHSHNCRLTTICCTIVLSGTQSMVEPTSSWVSTTRPKLFTLKPVFHLEKLFARSDVFLCRHRYSKSDIDKGKSCFVRRNSPGRKPAEIIYKLSIVYLKKRQGWPAKKQNCKENYNQCRSNENWSLFTSKLELCTQRKRHSTTETWK